MAHNAPPRPQNGLKTLVLAPSGLGTTLKKMIFFAPGTLVDPPLAPTVRGLCYPPAAPSDHWYGGLGGSLGDSERWNPQKVGDCGWTRCPRNWILSHVAQDTAWSSFRAFRGFGPKKAVLGHKMRSFGRAPPDLAPPPRATTGEFLAGNLDLARAPPRV